MTPKKKESLADIKTKDLLTLKKQVIEEIKSELEINKGVVSNLKQDQTKVLEQQQKDHKTMEPI